MLKIGVVIHGPEVMDSGSAQKVLDKLRSIGEVTAVLGGTMGRLAVIDAGLEDIIKISQHRRPSETIKDLQTSSDLIVLLSQAKTRESGLAFGAAVAAKSGSSIPIVQVDCGGGFVAVLTKNDDGNEHLATIATLLGLELLPRPVALENITREGSVVKRRLKGVQPGELISINGTVVAKSTATSVEVSAKDGRIVEVKGAVPKLHGIEKLPIIDIEMAIIRSGDIRRTEAKPRASDCRGNGAVVIDHCAEDAFKIAEGACLAITIGDDTTAIAGDILYRLGIPLIGIVDGDLDRLSHRTSMPKGSIVIRVAPGYDDLVGQRIKRMILKGRNRVIIERSDLARRVMEIAKEQIVQTLRY